MTDTAIGKMVLSSKVGQSMSRQQGGGGPPPSPPPSDASGDGAGGGPPRQPFNWWQPPQVPGRLAGGDMKIKVDPPEKFSG